MTAPLAPSVAATLERFQAALERDFGPRLAELRLFGSWARGEAHEESDVDVMVAIDDLTDTERTAVYGAAYRADLVNEWLVLLAPLVYSTEQVARMRGGGRRLFREIDQDGIVLKGAR